MTRHLDSGAPFLLDSWGTLTSASSYCSELSPLGTGLLAWGTIQHSRGKCAAYARVLQRAFGKVELEDNFGAKRKLAIYAERFYNAPFPRTF